MKHHHQIWLFHFLWNIVRTTRKMKTRRESKFSLIENKKYRRKKRNVDTFKVTKAVHQLVCTGAFSLQSKNDENHKKLAKRFKVPENAIRRIVNELQPTVTIEKM